MFEFWDSRARVVQMGQETPFVALRCENRPCVWGFTGSLPTLHARSKCIRDFGVARKNFDVLRKNVEVV